MIAVRCMALQAAYALDTHCNSRRETPPLVISNTL